jgi:DNA transformation protein
MAASDGFIELLKDSLCGLGPVSVRRMFGGAGVYADGVMFGLIVDDTFYLKADDETKSAFEAEGLAPFVYHGSGGTVAMSYWRIPERLLDDPDELVGWARTALDVARRKAAAKQRGVASRKVAPKHRRRD